MAERKVLKMTDQFISQNVLLRKENERLRLKLSLQKRTGRKTIEKDPNERFARIEEIAYVSAHAEDAAMAYERSHAPNIINHAMEIAQYNEVEMENVFQLS
ncbi:hypothetical protein BHE90_016559 [Fusarium euwallaceae]|uniref:Uncharacterized protein n=1 Tax=Fusarium euwallaceae TaxID=1147111 RepID=A0A430L022_9HYPO|nr:hypothetical protein BHE90_016559 [Fusarium euwallaceae]